MTTKVEIEIHHEPPLGVRGVISAYEREMRKWITVPAYAVRAYWGEYYTAWYAMPPAPERPKRYEVVETIVHGPFAVRNERTSRVVAEDSHTRAAAEAIADIYNEVAG